MRLRAAMPGDRWRHRFVAWLFSRLSRSAARYCIHCHNVLLSDLQPGRSDRTCHGRMLVGAPPAFECRWLDHNEYVVLREGESVSCMTSYTVWS